MVGEVEFYNIRLRVDQRALIPRPETEVLVEKVLGLLGTCKSARLLEIGTGSGNIAIAIAVNIDDIKITAVEKSQAALDLAAENARRCSVSDRIEFVCDDCLQKKFWGIKGRYDAIVSNPPYVANDDFENLQPEIKFYEPKNAILAGDDPLIFFDTIAENAVGLLEPRGFICFEVGDGQAAAVCSILKAKLPNIRVEIFKDLAGSERVVIGKLI